MVFLHENPTGKGLGGQSTNLGSLLKSGQLGFVWRFSKFGAVGKQIKPFQALAPR